MKYSIAAAILLAAIMAPFSATGQTDSKSGQSAAATEPQSAGNVFEINEVSFSNTNVDNAMLSDYGEPLVSSALRFVRPRITYTNPGNDCKMRLFIKFIDPAGELMRRPDSPEGFSFLEDVTVLSGTNQTNITGYGSSVNAVFHPGTYVCEIWSNGTLLKRTPFTVVAERPDALTVDGETALRVYFGREGGTRTLPVVSHGHEWQIDGTSSFCTIERKNNDAITLTCQPTETSSARISNVLISTYNQSVQMQVRQFGSMDAAITRIWTDSNYSNNGTDGLMIHCEVATTGLQGHSIEAVAYFYHPDASKLVSTDDEYCVRNSERQVMVYTPFSIPSDNYTAQDVQLFIPNSQLHVERAYLMFQIVLFDRNTGERYDTTQDVPFSVGI